jgi:Fur family ferric uptake transcriptional regulator
MIINDDLLPVLRDTGLKATRPRIAILRLLRDSDHHHFSVDDVYRAVRKEEPRVSMATVYRVLEDLAERRLVGYLRLGTDKTYYERRADPHRHAICRSCGMIRDVEPVHECLEACISQESGNGFRFDGTEVIFVGLCSACQAKPAFEAKGA